MTDQPTLPGISETNARRITPQEKAAVILDMHDHTLLTKVQTDPAWAAALVRELAFALVPDHD